MYAECSAGRTTHIAHIAFNFDRSSSLYLAERPKLPPNSNLDLAYLCVGTTRLPLSRGELPLVLWRFWELDPEQRLCREETEGEFVKRLECKVNALNQVVYHEAGTILSCYDTYRSSELAEDDPDHAGLWSSPIWVEAAETIFYCTQKVLIIDHLLSVLSIQRALIDTFELHITEPVYLVWKRLNRGANVRPLPEAVRLMEYHRDQAIGLEQGFELAAAVFQYTLAITAMMPWYPSLWYMDAWEAQLNGVAEVMFQCINRACYTLTKLGMFDCADKLLHLLHRSHCRTVQQLMASYTRKLQNIEARAKHRAKHLSLTGRTSAIYTAKDNKERFNLVVMQTHLRKRPPGDIATPHWYENFDPIKLVEHCKAARAEGGGVLKLGVGVHLPWVQWCAESASLHQLNLKTLGDKYWHVLQLRMEGREPELHPMSDEVLKLTDAERAFEATYKMMLHNHWGGMPSAAGSHAAPFKRSPYSWKHLATDLLAMMSFQDLQELSEVHRGYQGEHGMDYQLFEREVERLMQAANLGGAIDWGRIMKERGA